MAAQVYMPQKQQSDNGLGKLLTIGGMVGGAFAGGPGGAMAGAAAGGQLGGMTGGLLAKPASDPAQPVTAGALDRRLASLKESPQMQLRESIDSLKYIQDDATRAQLAQPLMLAQQQAGKARV